jgi:flagellar motor protein MotB
MAAIQWPCRAEHLSASDFAEYKPLADTTPERRAKNRRVELLVVMND